MYIFFFRILIGAVDKSTTNLQFKFFNNCFDDDFSQRECVHVCVCVTSVLYVHVYSVCGVCCVYSVSVVCCAYMCACMCGMCVNMYMFVICAYEY